MYGWGRGFSAGLSPAPRTDNPTYQYLGRFGSDTLVRDGDPADKLLLPIGHEFTAELSDPVPPVPPVSTTPAAPVVINSSPYVNPLGQPDILDTTHAVESWFSSIPWWGWLAGIGGGLYLWKGRK